MRKKDNDIIIINISNINDEVQIQNRNKFEVIDAVANPKHTIFIFIKLQVYYV